MDKSNPVGVAFLHSGAVFRRPSNCLFQRILHDGAGLVQLTGIQIHAGTWIVISVHIPGHGVVNDRQAVTKKNRIPQRCKNAAFPNQWRRIQQSDGTVMKIDVNRKITPGHSLHNFGNYFHSRLLSQTKKIIYYNKQTSFLQLEAHVSL